MAIQGGRIWLLALLKLLFTNGHGAFELDAKSCNPISNFTARDAEYFRGFGLISSSHI